MVEQFFINGTANFQFYKVVQFCVGHRNYAVMQKIIKKNLLKFEIQWWYCQDHCTNCEIVSVCNAPFLNNFTRIHLKFLVSSKG